MDRQPGLARRFFDRFEPVHAVTYFAPEARAALDGLGYRGFWMGYFAARSAPFGEVPTEVVAAAFYNFASHRVAKALPTAWEIAPPADALRAREQSAVAALRRYGVGDDDDLATAADLAAKAAIHLAELEPDVAAPQDDQVLGQEVDVHHARVGQVRGGVEALDQWDRGAPADVTGPG